MRCADGIRWFTINGGKGRDPGYLYVCFIILRGIEGCRCSAQLSSAPRGCVEICGKSSS